MQHRHHNWFWFLPALLLLAQSVIPWAVQADVQMRCVGMGAASVCVHASVPFSEAQAMTAQMAQMPCCHTTTPCPMLTHQSLMPHAKRCVITVTRRAAANAALLPSLKQAAFRHGHAWPSLTENALPSAAPRLITLSVIRLQTNLVHHPPAPAHGLRAPPSA